MDAGEDRVGTQLPGQHNGVRYADWPSRWTSLVEVVNLTSERDASVKRYVLRVPPDMPTAHAAVAWTLALAAKDYPPTAQT